MSKAERDKGARGERELVEWMQKITGLPWGRVPLSGSFHFDFPFDVYCKSKEPHVFTGVGNENKNTKAIKMSAWIEQTLSACEDFFQRKINTFWFIRFKYKGEVYFTIPEAYFEDLIRAKQHEQRDGDRLPLAVEQDRE